MTGAQAINSEDIFAGCAAKPLTLLLGVTTITCAGEAGVRPPMACIVPRSNQRIIGSGQGATIIAAASGTPDWIRLIETFPDAANIEIAGLQLDGNKAHVTGAKVQNHGIIVEQAHGIDIHDCWIHDTNGDGITLEGGGASSTTNFSISHVLFQNIGRAAVGIISAAYGTIDNNWCVTDVGFDCFHQEPDSVAQLGHDIEIAGNTGSCTGRGTAAHLVAIGGAGGSDYESIPNSSSWNIHDNMSNGCSGFAANTSIYTTWSRNIANNPPQGNPFSFVGVSHSIFADNILAGGAAVNTTYGHASGFVWDCIDPHRLYGGPANYCYNTITGNEARWAPGVGMAFDGAGGSTITRNTVYDLQNNASVQYGYGMAFNNCYGCIIDDNQIVDDQSPHQMVDGLVISGSTDVTLKTNVISGWTKNMILEGPGNTWAFLQQPGLAVPFAELMPAFPANTGSVATISDSSVGSDGAIAAGGCGPRCFTVNVRSDGAHWLVAGGPAFTAQSTPAVAFGSSYQVANATRVVVTVSYATSSDRVTAYSDSSSTPTTEITAVAAGAATGVASFEFEVLPGNYFRLVAAGSPVLTRVVEYQ
jgi:hypothetical protein